MRNNLPALTEKLLIWRHALDAVLFLAEHIEKVRVRHIRNVKHETEATLNASLPGASADPAH